MNLREAYLKLNIPETSTKEEVKKAYKNLVKSKHPDINKEPNAEEEFKKINEAYQVITSPEKEKISYNNNSWNPFDFQQFQQIKVPQHISINTTISFKESILGLKKDLKINRNIECKDCDGQGEFSLHNGCDKCGGKGTTVLRQGNMVFSHTCNKCMGRSPKEQCKSCNGEGSINSESSVLISIPPGVSNNNILRLAGLGNYYGNFGHARQYTDAHLHITIDPDPDLSLDGNDVVTIINIPLLDALKGCEKSVKTIDGEQNIKINPLTKNKDQVIINKMGVNRVGNQRVIVNVDYPENINSIIDALGQS